MASLLLIALTLLMIPWPTVTAAVLLIYQQRQQILIMMTLYMQQLRMTDLVVRLQ